LVGCCIFVFVNEKHLHAIKGVCVDIVKTGVGGKVGNKGATAVRFKLYNSRMCFICAHLPAGQGKASERNDDYHDITRKLDFGKGRTVDSHEYVTARPLSVVWWYLRMLPSVHPRAIAVDALKGSRADGSP
jgi:phosphatidylinositol-bisphosphatase